MFPLRRLSRLLTEGLDGGQVDTLDKLASEWINN